MKRNIILSGGGIHSIKIIGLLACLEDNNEIDFSKIEKYISSSGGSIISILLACGYTATELYSLIKSFYKYYECYLDNVDNILVNIIDNCGILDNRFLREWILDIIKNKIDKDDPTFMEFTKATGKIINICASNISEYKYEVFSIENSPNVKVIDALCASISIPIIFKPCKIGDSYYLDSGLLDNFPADYLPQKEYGDTIGVRIFSDYAPNKNELNLLSMMSSLYKTFVANSDKHVKTYENIKIYDIILPDNAIIDFDFDNLKFIINESVIDSFFKEGYEIAFNTLNTPIRNDKNNRNDRLDNKSAQP